MNELKDILDKAVSVQDRPVDPAADIARGRGELRKRRMTRFGAGAAGMAVIAAVSGVLVTGGSDGGSTPPALAGTTAPATTAAKGSLPGIQLVAYTGEQLPGYDVGFVPKGWEIQGGDDFTLTIAPKGFKDQDYNSFVGKIAVMLESKDAAGAEEDYVPTDEELKSWGMEPGSLDSTTTEIEVSGQEGKLRRDKETNDSPMVKVSFTDAKGHNVVVQGPLSLGWTDAQWVEFAEGVKVLGNAEAGVG
ncbi:hypothetical protein LWF15_15365 [Kineosporia rhizophila]|uniref:hypothetical protein n=1 Tax=Kineosporia rhizophila TaxID=84633 RepID=UPI001E35ED9C|nr:hypothetical protein [Kineosporia rhizophila]MCE0536882.1 hypothetical protein [Kineosporia rhizophila]